MRDIRGRSSSTSAHENGPLRHSTDRPSKVLRHENSQECDDEASGARGNDRAEHRAHQLTTQPPVNHLQPGRRCVRTRPSEEGNTQA